MSDDIDQIREAFRALDESRPTDLIGRLEARISSGLCYYDKADEALDREAIARIRELESRLATAEADALERAAKEVDCGCNGWCMDPVNCSREDAEAIRSLKPKTSE